MTADWQEFIHENRKESESFPDFVDRRTKLGIDTEGLIEIESSARRAHPPQTSFDQADLAHIFYPLLRRIEDAATSLHLKATRPVELVTSTDGTPGPLTRSASDRHMIFVGAGTAKFANGWATAYTDAADCFRRTGYDKSPTPELIWDLAQSGKREFFSCAFILARHYALYGSIVTAPVIEPNYERNHLTHRCLVLDAMEMFVLGHEYGHCIADEKIGNPASSLASAEARDLEFTCDRIGLMISKAASSQPPNLFSYSGTGAALFIRGVQLCEHGRQVWLSGTPKVAASDTHPSVTERLAAVRHVIGSVTPAADKAFTLGIFDYYDELASAVNAMVLTILVGMKKRGALVP